MTLFLVHAQWRARSTRSVLLLLVRQRVAISAGRALLVMGGHGNSIAVTIVIVVVVVVVINY